MLWWNLRIVLTNDQMPVIITTYGQLSQHHFDLYLPACLKELSEVEVMSPCFVCNSSKIRNTSHCDVLLTWKSISDLMMVTVCLTLNNTFKNGITDIDVSDDDKQICFGQCHATQY